jgi:serine/threonine protein kinase
MKIPGYSIEGQIGQGGMAVVYRAIQESLGRPVALKVMNPLLAVSPEFTARFLNEGRLLASLRHSHIMTIYDIGVSDGHYISWICGRRIHGNRYIKAFPRAALDC